jgi:hypothetical protein
MKIHETVNPVRFHPDAVAYDENEPGAWHVIRFSGETIGDGFHIVLATFPASIGAAHALHLYAKRNFWRAEDLRNHAAVTGGTIVHHGWLLWPWWSARHNQKMPRYEVFCGGVSYGIYEAPSPYLALCAMCEDKRTKHPADWFVPVKWTAVLREDDESNGCT